VKSKSKRARTREQERESKKRGGEKREEIDRERSKKR
jgi:hypothetical protein